MSVKEYIADKAIEIMIFFICIICIEIFLVLFNVILFLKIYVPLILVIGFSSCLFIQYLRRRNFYLELGENLHHLDKKFYIQSMIQEPEFIEGRILCDVLQEANKSMVENVNKYRQKEEDYRQYIELWVHEIKTPISSSKLMIENNRNEVTTSIEEEINKIDEFVEQAMYYSRSNVVEKDYMIKKYKLKTIIEDVVRKNKKELIGNNISVELDNLDITVQTDSKWMEYILNQIITNSIKYRSKEAKIKIYTIEKKEAVYLCIEDNGIGIKKEEIGRIFEKGFTGSIGRRYAKSTGMGLYLCKSLLTKLGQDITVTSDKGTLVTIIFPKNSMIQNVL